MTLIKEILPYGAFLTVALGLSLKIVDLLSKIKVLEGNVLSLERENVALKSEIADLKSLNSALKKENDDLKIEIDNEKNARRDRENRKNTISKYRFDTRTGIYKHLWTSDLVCPACLLSDPARESPLRVDAFGWTCSYDSNHRFSNPDIESVGKAAT